MTTHTITVDLKWFCFSQNNSGGSFVTDDNCAPVVFIQARNAAEAVAIGERFMDNRNNMPRTVMACWLTDEQAAETDADGVGLEGGWYECIDNWDDYTEVAIHEGEPSHWMPLPARPSNPPAQGIGPTPAAEAGEKS